MLPRQRVLAALDHREPDRIPWGEHSIDHTVYEDILGRPTFEQAKMRQTQAFWDGRRDEIVANCKRDKIDLVRALDMDIITVSYVPPRGYRPAPYEKIDAQTYRDPDGSIHRVSSVTGELMVYQRNTANYKPPTLDDLQDQIDALIDDPGDPDDSCYELARDVVNELKATHYIAMIPRVDVCFPGFGATQEDFWMSLLVEPEICRKIAQLQGHQMIRDLKAMARVGIDAVLPTGDLGSSVGLMASPQLYREMVFPWQKAYADQAHRLGMKVLKHCCGRIWDIIDDMAEIFDAYESIQAGAGMDIGRLKKRVGSKICLWGGILHENIISGSVHDIRSDARYAFEHAAPGGGYIMGSSHSLAVGARRENVMEMKRCRDQWGVYPIGGHGFQ